MNLESNIEKVKNAIVSWQSNDRKIVVGIEGCSGSGKTTLLRALAENNADVLPVHRDDFMYSKEDRRKRIKEAPNMKWAMEYACIDLSKLRNFIETYRVTDEVFTQCTLNPHTNFENPGTGECDYEQKYDFSKSILVLEGIFLFHPHQCDDLFDYRIFIKTDRTEADKRVEKREMNRWGEQYYMYPIDAPNSWHKLTQDAFEEYAKKYSPNERADLVLSMK